MGITKTGYFETLFGLRKKLFLTFYTLTVILIIVLLMMLVDASFSVPTKMLLLFGFFLTIAGVVGGAILGVYFDLPSISSDFDKIKNDIARKTIKTPEEFGQRLTRLLCDFFTFQFLKIEYSFIKIVDTPCVYSEPDLVKPGNMSLDDFEVDVSKRSKESEEIFAYGIFQVNSKSYNLYILPIWFGHDWLGFIGLFSPRKIRKTFLMFLKDFENEFIDDQLIHVLDYKKSRIQKQFYKRFDEISNKITRGVYTNLVDFEKDILRFLISEIGCAGGLFATIYNSKIELSWRDDASKDEDVLNYYEDYFRKYPLPSKAKILQDSNIGFKFIFEMPIFLDKLQGVILLFDNDDQKFKYFENTLFEIENIKLDNDLENLAIMLDLKPDNDSPIASVLNSRGT